MKPSILFLLNIILLSTLIACTPTATNRLEPPLKSNFTPAPQEELYAPHPAPAQADLSAPAENEPVSDFFHLIPTQKVGQLVTIEEYAIQIVDVYIDKEQLSLELYLENNSHETIDLGWAIQLRDADGKLIPAIQEDASLANNQMAGNETRTQLNQYDLSQIDESIEDSINPYGLLYAPVGWSGPVFTFQLTPTNVEGN